MLSEKLLKKLLKMLLEIKNVVETGKMLLTNVVETGKVVEISCC